MKIFSGVVFRAARDFFDDNCLHLAAAISYYVLFSLFPLLIVLTSVLGLFLQNYEVQQKIIDLVVQVIPAFGPEDENAVTKALRGLADLSSSTISLAGMLAMIWAASNMFGVLRSSINIAYNVEIRRPLVKQKLVDLAMIPGIGLFFLLSIAGTTVVQVIQEWSAGWSNFILLQKLITENALLWGVVSWAVPFLLSMMAFSVLYGLVPATRLPLRSVLIGAAFSSLLFELSKAGFAFYLQKVARYNLVFGPLGAVVAFLFWVYLSAAVLLFGAEIAAEHSRLRKSRM